MNKRNELELLKDKIRFLSGNIEYLNNSSTIKGVGIDTDKVQVWFYGDDINSAIKDAVVEWAENQLASAQELLPSLEQEAIQEQEAEESQAQELEAVRKKELEDNEVARLKLEFDEEVRKQIIIMKAQEEAKKILNGDGALTSGTDNG